LDSISSYSWIIKKNDYLKQKIFFVLNDPVYSWFFIYFILLIILIVNRIFFYNLILNFFYSIWKKNIYSTWKKNIYSTYHRLRHGALLLPSQRIFYIRYVIYSLILYPVYIFVFWAFISHVRYFYKDRVMQLLYDLNFLDMLGRGNRFASIAWTFFEQPHCHGDFMKQLNETREIVVPFLIFLFFCWNIYYILATFSPVIEAYTELCRPGILIFVHLYLAIHTSINYWFWELYYEYLHLGFFCAMGWVLFPFMYWGCVTLEDYSDEEEEIDFFHIEDEILADDHMEEHWGGSEISAIFWDIILGFYKAFYYIWKYTSIDRFFISDEEKRFREIQHKRTVREFATKILKNTKGEWMKTPDHHLFDEKKKITEKHLRIYVRRSQSSKWRMMYFQDSVQMRILVGIENFVVRLFWRIVSKIQRKKKFVYFKRWEKRFIPLWTKHNVPYFKTGGNSMPPTLYDGAMWTSRRMRWEGDEGDFNNFYMTHHLNALLNTNVWENEFKKKFMEADPDSVDRKVLFYMEVVYKLRLHFFYKHLGVGNSKQIIGYKRKQVIKMLWFGEMEGHRSSGLYLRDVRISFEYFKWRFTDIASVFYPFIVILNKLWDEKYLAVPWQFKYKYDYLEQAKSWYKFSIINDYLINSTYVWYDPYSKKIEYNLFPLSKRELKYLKHDISTPLIIGVGEYEYLIDPNIRQLYKEQISFILMKHYLVWNKEENSGAKYSSTSILEPTYFARTNAKWKSDYKKVLFYNIHKVTIRSWVNLTIFNLKINPLLTIFSVFKAFIISIFKVLWFSFLILTKILSWLFWKILFHCGGFAFGTFFFLFIYIPIWQMFLYPLGLRTYRFFFFQIKWLFQFKKWYKQKDIFKTKIYRDQTRFLSLGNNTVVSSKNMLFTDIKKRWILHALKMTFIYIRSIDKMLQGSVFKKLYLDRTFEIINLTLGRINWWCNNNQDISKHFFLGKVFRKNFFKKNNKHFIKSIYHDKYHVHFLRNEWEELFQYKYKFDKQPKIVPYKARRWFKASSIKNKKNYYNLHALLTLKPKKVDYIVRKFGNKRLKYRIELSPLKIFEQRRNKLYFRYLTDKELDHVEFLYKRVVAIKEYMKAYDIATGWYSENWQELTKENLDKWDIHDIDHETVKNNKK